MFLLYLCFATVSALAAPGQNVTSRHLAAAKTVQGRIVGGTEVDSISQYPYNVQIRIYSEFCGGAIISENYILSAGQCLDGNDPETLEVRAGNVVQGQGALIPIAEVEVHPDYDYPRYNYDIGYMRTESPIQFTDEIGPVALSKYGLEYDDLTVTGWGNHGDQRRRLNVLNAAQLTVVGLGRCQLAHATPLTKNQICAENTRDMDAGICKNDVGGPAVDEAYNLIGISSFSAGCGPGMAPGVFTYLNSPEIVRFITGNTGVIYR